MSVALELTPAGSASLFFHACRKPTQMLDSDEITRDVTVSTAYVSSLTLTTPSLKASRDRMIISLNAATSGLVVRRKCIPPLTQEGSIIFISRQILQRVTT